jgi:cytochrome c-type biogenesis protein CcmH/NrfG
MTYSILVPLCAVLLDGAFGDSDGATDAYRRAIQCDPSHSFAWFNLAVCLNNAYQGEWDDDSDRASVALEAEGAFRRALKLRPNDAQSMLGLADMLLKNKQGSTSTQRQTQREAEMLLILALGVDPTNVSVNVKLGKLLRSRRRFDEARS